MRGRLRTKAAAPGVEDKTGNNAQLGEQRGENGGVGRTGEATVGRAGEDARGLRRARGRASGGGRAASGLLAAGLEAEEPVRVCGYATWVRG